MRSGTGVAGGLDLGAGAAPDTRCGCARGAARVWVGAQVHRRGTHQGRGPCREAGPVSLWQEQASGAQTRSSHRALRHVPDALLKRLVRDLPSSSLRPCLPGISQCLPTPGVSRPVRFPTRAARFRSPVTAAFRPPCRLRPAFGSLRPLGGKGTVAFCPESLKEIALQHRN